MSKVLQDLFDCLLLTAAGFSGMVNVSQFLFYLSMGQREKNPWRARHAKLSMPKYIPELLS